MIGASVKWDRDPVAKLDQLKTSIQRRISKKAVRAGAKPVKSAMREAVPVDSGALKQSLGTKIVDRKGSAAAIVGPRSSYRKGERQPSRYASQVDQGTVKMQARQWRKQTWDRCRVQAVGAVKRTYAEEIQAELGGR